MMRVKFAGAALSLMLAACSQTANPDGPWVVNSKESRVGYVTTKAQSIAETNFFASVSGAVDKAGKANIEIVLDSVATGIDIRDERMREFLFETAKFPMATVTANIDLDTLQSLRISERTTQNISLSVDMKNVQNSYDAQAIIIRIGAEKVLVEAANPIIVQASDFGLEEGLGKLQELAGLPSITPVVPVSFSLTFEQRNDGG